MLTTIQIATAVPKRIIPAPIRTARGSSDILGKLTYGNFGSYPIFNQMLASADAFFTNVL
jgi:hypothetical protein